MLRRWCMALALAALTVGTALTATSASAAPTGVEHFSPGGVAHLMGVSAAHGRGLSYQAESTNWSGYAGTTGRYTSVSASWTQPARLQPGRPVRRVLGRTGWLHQQHRGADR